MPGLPWESWHCRQGGREGCVRFRHLRRLIKKTADSISSALQIPLLQEQQPWKTASAVSSAWKIPKAAEAGVCGKGDAACREHGAAVGAQLHKFTLERLPLTVLHSQPTAPVPQGPTVLFEEEFSPQCNLSWCLPQHCTESWARLPSNPISLHQSHTIHVQKGFPQIKGDNNYLLNTGHAELISEISRSIHWSPGVGQAVESSQSPCELLSCCLRHPAERGAIKNPGTCSGIPVQSAEI